MNENIVYNSSCEDNKYLIDIKEEPLDASSVTDNGTIEHGSRRLIIQDGINVKEELLESMDESDFDFKMGLFNLLKLNSQVCGINYALEILLLWLIYLYSL